MKTLLMTMIFTFLLGASNAFADEGQLQHGIVCPSLDINFLGGRYGDKIHFEPNKEFFNGLISKQEYDKNLASLELSFFARFGTCEKGEGNILVECISDHKIPSSIMFGHSNQVGNSNFTEYVLISRRIDISDMNLKVVTGPAKDSYNNKDIVNAKIVLSAVVNTSEGEKIINHEQRVGQWLNPIPSNRSDYGLCVFK